MMQQSLGDSTPEIFNTDQETDRCKRRVRSARWTVAVDLDNVIERLWRSRNRFTCTNCRTALKPSE